MQGSKQVPPSIDSIARSIKGLPHPIAVEIARQAVEQDQLEDLHVMARIRARRMLGPVINATGTLLHTNLGRAPLAVQTESSYYNLELDLETGQRGSRQDTVGPLLASTCGAEAAIVVNNCASAVLLTLSALAKPTDSQRGVVVSRGELVEIGGGFRIPEVMTQSGAELIEVGTTNRTRLGDYADKVSIASLLLKVHRSNYAVVGFTEETTVPELVKLANSHDLPLVVDIGSGLIDSGCPWLKGPPPRWLADEPAVRQTLQAGADLVTFSGDKLFGGPQAGVIAGRADLVEACAKHPLARVCRPGSLVLQAMQDVTMAYLDRRGGDIPFWEMATRSVEQLQHRASLLLERFSSADLNEVQATATVAVTGGGTLPMVSFPSFGLKVAGDISQTLRAAERPIIVRVEKGNTILDLRTIDPDDDELVAQACMAALGYGAL